MVNLLYACQENRTRSSYAEIRTVELVNELNISGLNVCSAGISSSDYLGMTNEMAAALVQLGCRYNNEELYQHKPVKLTKELLDMQGIVLCMKQSHIERILDISPGFNGKICTLPAYAGFENEEVIDPGTRIRELSHAPRLFRRKGFRPDYESSVNEYKKTVMEIDKYVEAVLQKMIKEGLIASSEKNSWLFN